MSVAYTWGGQRRWTWPGPPPPAAPKFKPFTPFVPEAPPTGSYDPSLDVSLAAANRGYGDVQGDISTQEARGTTDYLTQLGQLDRSAGWDRQDLGTRRQAVETDFGRSLADLLTGKQREGQDYSTSIGNLLQAYKVRAGQQLQHANAAGLLGGSALAQAAARRGAHQAQDRAPIDTSHARYGADATLREQRLHEDEASALSAIDTEAQRRAALTADRRDQLNLLSAPPTADNPLGGRSFQDLITQLQRAGREHTQYGIDVGTIKAAQAAQAGWSPPARPGNEFVGPDGKPYRVVISGNETIGLDPSGRVLWRRPRR